jgi:hypothetical protein
VGRTAIVTTLAIFTVQCYVSAKISRALEFIFFNPDSFLDYVAGVGGPAIAIIASNGGGRIGVTFGLNVHGLRR